MITQISKLKDELIQISHGKKLISDEVVQASQHLDKYIVNHMKKQIEQKKNSVI